MSSLLLLLGLLTMPGFITAPSSTASNTQSTASSTSIATPMSTTTMSTTASQTSESSSTGSSTSMTTATSAGNMSTTAMSMLYCPEFSCNYSDCNAMYGSQNATQCAAGQWCKLCKMDMFYHMVGCSHTCGRLCTNTSQTNCTVFCCNATDCLNHTFASMEMPMMSTAAATSAGVTTAAITPPTTADHSNKCHQGTCTGPTCYTSISTPMKCSSTQVHCQLKKEMVGSDMRWTAGCTTNCGGQTACTATTQPPCHLECCNATLTSCLWLNGTMNVFSSATTGPLLQAELMTFLLGFLVASGFLL